MIFTKTRWVLMVLPILAVLGLPQEKQPTTEINDFSGPINDFSLDFHHLLAEDANKNIVSSPLGVYIMLLTMAAGSNEATFEQIQTALYLQRQNFQTYFAGMHDLIKRLNTVGVTKLTMANRIFANINLEIREDYQRDIITHCNTFTQFIDFSYGQKSSSTINNWVGKQTNQLVSNIVQPDDFDIRTNLVLVNTLYFQSPWYNKFEESSIMFKVGGEFKRADSITSQGQYAYRELSNIAASAVEIPYQSNNYSSDKISMIIIVPKINVSLDDVEKKLEKYGLPTFKDKNIIELNLSLPKFEVSSTIDLSLPLRKLGINDLFDNPDFSNMTNSEIHISKMVQKVVINVNAAGTEIDDFSNAGFNGESYHPRPQKILTVDSPFLVFIRTEDIILFTGRIVNPLTYSNNFIGEKVVGSSVVLGNY